MITAIRLKERNTRIGNDLRSYTSSRGNKYEAGNGVIPSAWRLVKNQAELSEVSEINQFQIMQFENESEFEEFLMNDMERGVRDGKPAVRAQVRKTESTTPMSRISDEARNSKNKEEAVKLSAAMLRPTPIGETVVGDDAGKDAAEEVPTSYESTVVKPSKRTGRRATKKKKS